MGKISVSILGCGWLGVPLAKKLLAAGFDVKGSVTSPEKLELLEREGIQPYRVVLNHDSCSVSNPDFFNCDILIISIPPRRMEGIEEIFPLQIKQLIPEIIRCNIQKVIFISSTSVYPENFQTATETDETFPDKPSGKALVTAENLLKGEDIFQTTIIRFGGLIGADRNPARFLLRAKTAVSNSPVNLIHQDDCIGMIRAIIDQQLWGETLNACCPEHPYKKDFYGKAAQISGLPEPLISAAKESYKIVDSSKLIQLLNYQFIYPSPMDYLNSLSGI
ncbi:MAG: NAD(P)-binding domain-containing protein [Prolixibacteraceae bacterium]|nr:NAD(P)-binding domain-containing protein [Prolixibacteraceae bacterium]